MDISFVMWIHLAREDAKADDGLPPSSVYIARPSTVRRKGSRYLPLYLSVLSVYYVRSSVVENRKGFMVNSLIL